jgi:hypothetical protein
VPKGRGEEFRAIRHDDYEDAGSGATGNNSEPPVSAVTFDDLGDGRAEMV